MADGNCLYRSLACIITRSEKQHIAIRTAIYFRAHDKPSHRKMALRPVWHPLPKSSLLVIWRDLKHSWAKSSMLFTGSQRACMFSSLLAANLHMYGCHLWQNLFSRTFRVITLDLWWNFIRLIVQSFMMLNHEIKSFHYGHVVNPLLHFLFHREHLLLFATWSWTFSKSPPTCLIVDIAVSQ